MANSIYQNFQQGVVMLLLTWLSYDEMLTTGGILKRGEFLMFWTYLE